MSNIKKALIRVHRRSKKVNPAPPPLDSAVWPVESKGTATDWGMGNWEWGIGNGELGMGNWN
ncbi:MAG: hypothetical protein ACM65M_24360 [Microcoleus sp.]